MKQYILGPPEGIQQLIKEYTNLKENEQALEVLKLVISSIIENEHISFSTSNITRQATYFLKHYHTISTEHNVRTTLIRQYIIY